MREITSRALRLPDLSKHSVFLWGPRGTGKSFWIRTHLPDAPLLDLLKTDTFAEYAARPSLLRERFGAGHHGEHRQPIVIDEVQKVPALLDEVHWLMENRHLTFLLTGSSARKLRRGHANLLAGRARRREMRPLCFPEADDIDIGRVVISGLLPPHYLSTEPLEDIRAYVNDYLKEEIVAEALTANLPAFAEFLRVVALTNSELLNYANVASEAGVSAKTVRSYFEILEDTFLGFRLEPWTRSRKRRMILTEKFYLFDVGIANYLARRAPQAGTPEFGKSFEHYILMELTAFRSYRAPDMEIRYWRTSTGREVDFIINDKEIAIEVKASPRVSDAHVRGSGDVRFLHDVALRPVAMPAGASFQAAGLALGRGSSRAFLAASSGCVGKGTPTMNLQGSGWQRASFHFREICEHPRFRLDRKLLMSEIEFKLKHYLKRSISRATPSEFVFELWRECPALRLRLPVEFPVAQCKTGKNDNNSNEKNDGHKNIKPFHRLPKPRFGQLCHHAHPQQGLTCNP